MTDTVQSIVNKTLQTAGSVEVARVLAKKFFEELREYAQKLPHTLQESTRKETAMDLHKLIGACAYFGATELYTALLEAERVVKTEAPALADVQLNKIIHHLNTTAALEHAVLSIL